MQKKVSERSFLSNPHTYAYSLLIPENAIIASFPIKCSLKQDSLKYPVVNLKCTPRCYMNMDAFLNIHGDKNIYTCTKCNENRFTADVVYDIGFEMILDPENTKKNSNREEIHIDRDGRVYKERKAPLNEGIINKVKEVQIKKINNVRDNPNIVNECSLVVDMESLREEMNMYYKKLMASIKNDKNFLFCRGKAAERGGRQHFSTIYIYDKEQPYHLNLQFEGKEACIKNEGEVHYIPERRAFYIVANQGRKLRLFEGKIDNIVGNRLELTERDIQVNSRQFFGIAHSQKHIFIVGGLENNRTVNTVVAINLDNSQIDTLPTMKEDRAAVKACFYKNKLYVIGGATKSTAYTRTRFHQVFDFNSKSWSQFETTFNGFNMGVFVSNNNLIVYGGSQDSNNEKFINQYYILNPDNFNIISKGSIYEKELKLEFEHENHGVDGSVLRVASKPENQVYLLTFGQKIASVNTKLRLDI